MKGTQVFDNHTQKREEADITALKRWQDVFCKVAGVYAFLLDEEGEALTELSGSPVEVAELMGAVTEKRIADIRRRVVESDIEDQAVEITGIPNLRLCAVAVREPGRAPLTWILFAVLKDSLEDASMYSRPPLTQFSREVTEEELYRAMDLVRDTMQILPAFTGEAAEQPEAVMPAATNPQDELSRLFLRAKTMTEIVSLLDSQENIDVTMEALIRHVGEFINLSHAFICQTHRADDRIDIVTQWNCEGGTRLFDHVDGISRFWFLRDSKTLILHHDSQMSFGEREHLDDLGIKSLIVIPIEVSGRIGFYACFTENRRERHWDIEEIKFISDAIKILHSIIARRVQQNSLASSFQSLEAILDNVGSAIYVRDMNTDAILFANRSLKSRFSREMETNKLGQLFERDIPPNVLSGNYEIYDEDRERWYDLYYTHIVWVDGRPVSLFATYDVTDKKLYQKRIEQQAYTDFLTGLYNRMCCERDLTHYVDEATKAGSPGALCYLDLDDFKHINDGLGHQYGDLLLQTISKSLRGVDGISNTCYRMGGDEFVIIIAPGSYGAFEEILDTIKGMFARPWYLKDTDYYCTMSMGIVEFPKDGTTVTELIKKADIAMYEAKKAGKNRVAKYTDSIDSSSFRRLDMEKNMRDATMDGYNEFEVYYQPIIDVQKADEPCIGAEALIRWNSSKMGLVSPGEFIPLAEYLGLINPIGNHVLQTACENCVKWNDELKKKNPSTLMRINVNLSVVQLLQNDIVDVIERAILSSGIRPKDLTLEVTESLAINDLDRTKMILDKIKRLGVKLALDDFGTGYSSLNNIRVLPFDIIKVDQNFVKDLATDSYSQAFIRMVAELGDAIGAEVCVEGIENEAQLKVLEGMDVKYIQGFYFDKPLTQAVFEDHYIYNNKTRPARRPV